MKIKRPKIRPDLTKPMQEYADNHFDGNFTEAVNFALYDLLKWNEIARISELQAKAMKMLGRNNEP